MKLFPVGGLEDVVDRMVFAVERRDHDARRLRNQLAEILGIHPRELGQADAPVVAKILHRMNQMTDELGRLQRTAAADDLTGVMRRGAGMDALARELDRASRGTHQLVVAFLDLDGLKSINDTLGHAAGDQVIRQMASVVRGHLRSYDFVVRWGGDEFLCVLPDAGIDGARRLLRDTSLTMARNGGATFSAGFAVWERGESTADLIARADQDLYRQRQHRRQMDLPA